MKNKHWGLLALLAQQSVVRLKNRGVRINAGLIFKDGVWKPHAHVTEYYSYHDLCVDCRPIKELLNENTVQAA